MTIVETLMKTKLVFARADETVAHAAWSMARNGVGAALVVESGAVAGLLSERDVLVRVVAEGLEPTTTKVTDVATTEVVCVNVNSSIRECAKLIQANGIRQLPVLENGKAVGILSSRDFFAYVVKELENLVRKELYKQELSIGTDPYDHLGGSYDR